MSACDILPEEILPWLTMSADNVPNLLFSKSLFIFIDFVFRLHEKHCFSIMSNIGLHRQRLILFHSLL